MRQVFVDWAWAERELIEKRRAARNFKEVFVGG